MSNNVKQTNTTTHCTSDSYVPLSTSICWRITYLSLSSDYSMGLMLFLAHLIEHLLEVGFGVDPGRHCITEEDEVLYNATWIHTDHVTHSTERRILLLVITDIT